MLNTENAVIEILPGKVDDSTAPGRYIETCKCCMGLWPESRRLTGSLELTAASSTAHRRMRKFSWLQNMCAKPNGMSRGQRWPAWNGRAERRRTEL